MVKLKWMKFEPDAWLYDTRILSHIERAAWIDLLCFMWNAPSRGMLEGHPQDLARLVHMDWLDFQVVLDSLKTKGVADVTISNQKVTVVCRRMLRESNLAEKNRLRQEKYRESNRLKQHRHREKSSNAKVTLETKDLRLNNKPPIVPMNGDGSLFDEFWKTYPKKVGRGAAEKSWIKLKPSADLFSTMMEAICIQRKSEQWIKEDGRYIPNPSTWLNQKRWLDELKPKEDDYGWLR